MEDNQIPKRPDQVNPGQTRQDGQEVVIKKNEGISDQGNEWSDEEGITSNESSVLGVKAEKYLKESANIEDLPDEADNKEAENFIKNRNASIAEGDNKEDTDEVIENEDEKVPGYDLGKNKLQ